MEVKRVVVKLIDRIIHPGTTDLDREQTLIGLRRVLNGKMPSDVVLTDSPKPRRSHDAWQQKISDLERKITEVESAKATSERERLCQIKQLVAEIAKLRAGQERHAADDQRDHYTYDEVLQAMIKKFSKHHGIPAALAERNKQLYPIDPSIGRITPTLIQQWRVLNRFPRYVMDQLDAMTTNDVLPRRGWNDAERLFLRQLYMADERQSNQTLAAACSCQFGRLVTECSIKGELNRLRQKGTVSLYRPKEARSANQASQAADA